MDKLIPHPQNMDQPNPWPPDHRPPKPRPPMNKITDICENSIFPLTESEKSQKEIFWDAPQCAAKTDVVDINSQKVHGISNIAVPRTHF